MIVEEASLGREGVCDTHCCQVQTAVLRNTVMSAVLGICRRKSRRKHWLRALVAADSQDASYCRGFLVGSLSIRGAPS